MSPRQQRTRIAPGVYRDAIGIAARVELRGHRREHRFPRATPLHVIRAWQDETRRALALLPPRAGRHTFAADAERYLALVGHLASMTSVRAELRAWIARLGPLPRYRITATHVREAVVAWSQAGVAPKTINNRLDRLRRIWRVLDGRRAPTPADEVDPLPVARTPIRMVPYAVIEDVAATLEMAERAGLLRTARTRARFLLRALTGRRPSEIMRAQPEDVDLERRTWSVRDGKGGSTPGLVLTEAMLAAWRLFIESRAWGPFETSAFARTIRAAGWPAGLRPYMLRHTVGLTLSEAGVDLADVAAWMGHRRLETTRRHYVPVLHSRIQEAAERLAARESGHPSGARGETA
jgi:integrase